MPHVFRTKDDSPDPFNVAGVPGLAAAHGRGGIVVEDAADTMVELQDQGKALTGKALKDAAGDYADAHGLVVRLVSDKQVADLPQELGDPPNRPPAAQVAQEGYEALYGDLSPEETENTQGAAVGAGSKED